MRRKHVLSKYNESHVIDSFGNTDNYVAEQTTLKNSTLGTRYIEGLPSGIRTEETRSIEVSDSDEIVSREVMMNGMGLPQIDDGANIIIKKSIVINSKICGPTALTENIDVFCNSKV